MIDLTGRGKLPPRDIEKSQIAFARLRDTGLITRVFSAKEIRQVRKYLMHLGADTTWRRIAQGDLIGYTILVHEQAELAYFRHRRADPFKHRDFVAYYEEAHAYALVEEHRVHQRIAHQVLKYDLNIATLVARNPIVDEDTRRDDLALLVRFTDHWAVRESDVSKADEYYQKLLMGELG